MFNNIVNARIYAFLLFFMISGWVHLVGSTVDELYRISLSIWAIGIQVSAYLLAGIGILFNFSNCMALLKQSGLLVLLLILACISLLWSSDYFFTATRLIGAMGIVAIALLIASRFAVVELLQWVLWFFFLWALANYISVFFFPEMSLSIAGDYSSAWKGISHQKNILAQSMVVFLVIAYIRFLLQKVSLSSLGIVVVIATPLLYFSQSMTANVLLCVGVFLAAFIHLYYQRQFSFHWIVLSCLVLITFMFIFKAELLSLVGKSETLTGRTITWAIVYEQAQMMPLLGHGYAIWVDSSLAPSQHEELLSFGGHNGYLDILFWFGWLGVILFGLFIFDMSKKLYTLLINRHEASSLLFLSVFFVMFLLANITESIMLVRSGILWTLFVIVVFKINQIYAQYVLQQNSYPDV